MTRSRIRDRMKKIAVIIVLILASWKAAVFIVNKNSSALAEMSGLAVKANRQDSLKLAANTAPATGKILDTIPKNYSVLPGQKRDTPVLQGQQIVSFAKTLIGTPYLYGSTDPAQGFDCSGFITYVFNHFNITVPRSSIDFTNAGKEVSIAEAAPGDLILFTGTDSTERFVGHMGIVTDNMKELQFIHSTSGKTYGVTITPLNDYYKKRYVKIVRMVL